MKKEIVYTLAYNSESDITKAEKLVGELYEKYNCVDVYPHGLSEIKIIATDAF